MRRGDWERRFGAARRRSDRELLAELERRIGLEEALVAIEDRIRAGLEGAAAAQDEAREARERLARVFGRPIAGGHSAAS